MNTDLFDACYKTVKRRGRTITRREFTAEVLMLYLAQGNVPVALTDAEKTERFERAQEKGVEVMDQFGRKKWEVKEDWGE